MQKSTVSVSPVSSAHGQPLERGSLAKRLRELRIAAGLSQAALGSVLGRPQSYVSKIESAQRRVELVEIQDWARACGKAIQWTFVDPSEAGFDDAAASGELGETLWDRGDLAGTVAWLVPRLAGADRALLESTIRYLMERQDTERR